MNMLAMSPLSPTMGLLNYPLELGTDQGFENFDFDYIFSPPCFSSPQQEACQVDQQEYVNDVKRSESPQGTSSTDHSDNPMLSKKLSHNASERDRRKKINDMYSSLRALLPGIDQRKKLSIPRTVGRALEYIPELQKEVEDLNHRMQAILSKNSALQGYACNQDENPKKCVTKESSSCFISTNKLCNNEMVIQISTLETSISISEVIVFLEKNNYLVIDVSSSQSFGGRTFYNIHLWIDGSYNNVNYEKLNEVLLLMLEKHKQMCF